MTAFLEHIIIEAVYGQESFRTQCVYGQESFRTQCVYGQESFRTQLCTIKRSLISKMILDRDYVHHPFLQAFLQQVLLPGLDARGGSYRLCLQHR